jgi:hypothetical protein
MILRYALGIVGATLFGATSVYILVAWRKAPRAARAMKWIAAASLSAGVIIGILAVQALGRFAGEGSGDTFGIGRANPCSPDGVPAADLGKALVLQNQKHVSDPNWMDIMDSRELCSLEGVAKTSSMCVAYFLARHAIGSDLTAGDTRKCIPYEEVAEICGLGNPEPDSWFCKQAFKFQRQRLKP